jgi:TPR repeat protein
VSRNLLLSTGLPLLLGAALFVGGCQTSAPPPPPPPPTAEQLTAAGMEALRKHDWNAALAAFVPAANQGDTQAQVALGSLYFTGFGVTRDFADATHWFTPAAEKGDPVAEFTLGLMSDLGGTGVLQNRTEAAPR